MSDLLTKLRNFESFLTKNVEVQGIVGQAADTIESLTSENTRIRALLYEEVMDSYYALASHKQARYAGPREYADYVFAYEGIAPPPSHKGED